MNKKFDTYELLRKKPDKIKRGNNNGAARPTAASDLGDIIESNIAKPNAT